MMMNQPQKTALADAIWELLQGDAQTEPPRDVHHVLDGGALIHRIPWPQGSVSYKELCLLYYNYVAKKYGTPTVVFDGYEELLTTKRRQWRAKGKVGATVDFTPEMKRVMKKDVFLSNPENKQKFIKMLAVFLETEIGCQMYQAKGDADVLIVMTAVETAKQKTAVLVGDDTDLLVLLPYYTSPSCKFELFFRPEPKTNSTKRRSWNIKKVQEQIRKDVCRDILFIHAVLGCDTTSRIHGFGKGASLKMYNKSSHFREQAKVFSSSKSTKDEVITAGQNALVSLYRGKIGEQLDDLRYTIYCAKLAKSTSQIQPQTLPPTADATKYHSLRVYLQIQQ